MQSTVPLMMHGDAVPTVGCAKVWAKLMQCFSWSGLLSTGSTKERSFFSLGSNSVQVWHHAWPNCNLHVSVHSVWGQAMGRVSCQPNCVGSRLILFAIWGWSFGAKGLFCIFQKVETFAQACFFRSLSNFLIMDQNPL